VWNGVKDRFLTLSNLGLRGLLLYLELEFDSCRMV